MYGKLFSTGITVYYGYAGGGEYGWWAMVTFQDRGHCDRGSVSGKLVTQYADNIQFSIDTIKRDAEKLGIEFLSTFHEKPHLYYLNDGGSKDYPPPAGWIELLQLEAERIGFYCIYTLQNPPNLRIQPTPTARRRFNQSPRRG